MIRLEGVTKRYPSMERPAVDDVTFEVPAGEITALIGPSGSGKSTTLRMVNRLIEPDEGSIYVGVDEIHDIKAEDLRRRIGYAIQGVGLFPHWTVFQNIGCVPWLLHWDKPRIAARVRELLDLVGLDAAEYSAKYPSQLSGGEAQRVGVARALAADPPVLLMDEPFGAVDPLTRERLQSEFLAIQHKLRKTVLFVTHDLDEAIRVADRIALMRDGALMQHDCVERVIAYPANEFVREFVGTERALKRLSLAHVAEEMGPPGRAAATEGRVPDGATLRTALAVMLEHGERAASVIAEDGSVVGSVTIDDILAHFERPLS